MLVFVLIVRGLNHLNREFISLPDGGTVSLNWPDKQSSLADDAPVVLFLHGMTGDSSDFVSFFRLCAARGWR